MISDVAFVVRLVAVAAMVTLALTKLQNLRATSDGIAALRAWPAASRPVLLAGVAVMEMTGGASLVLGLAHGVVAAGGAVGLGTVLTLAGLFNMQRTGDCGCGAGHLAAPRSSHQLVGRNSAIFVGLATGALLGPPVDVIVREPRFALLSAMLPIAMLLMGWLLASVRPTA